MFSSRVTQGSGPAIDLIIILALSLLIVPLVALDSGPLRVVLGVAFVLFCPGYALVAALFPRRDALDGIERLALSFGLSIALVPLIGLALNYTPWGIRLYPMLVSLVLFIAVASGIAWQRRQRLSPEERFQPQFRLSLSSLAHHSAGQGPWDKLLTILLIMAIFGAIGTVAYVVAKPKVGERFTEFYILGPGGKAEGYPQELFVGEEAAVILGITNQEHETTAYRVAVTMGGVRIGEVGPIALDHQGNWEQEFRLAPAREGPNQKVEFLLYRGEVSEPYRTLHLWVDVEQR